MKTMDAVGIDYEELRRQIRRGQGGRATQPHASKGDRQHYSRKQKHKKGYTEVDE